MAANEVGYCMRCHRNRLHSACDSNSIYPPTRLQSFSLHVGSSFTRRRLGLVLTRCDDEGGTSHDLTTDLAPHARICACTSWVSCTSKEASRGWLATARGRRQAHLGAFTRLRILPVGSTSRILVRPVLDPDRFANVELGAIVYHLSLIHI